MTDKQPPAMLDGPNGRIATLRREGSGPTVVWLGGYASDMRGTKAETLDAWAARSGRAFFRFDYTGHGESEGAFEDGTIGRWLADARATLAQVDGTLVLVGSSMGAWIAGLLAREDSSRLAGLLLLAPAPDFTQDLTRKGWSEEERARLERDGRIAFPSAYDDSEMVYTRALFEDGANHLLLHAPLEVRCPVRIIQGTKDDAVPWTHAVRYAEHMTAEDVTVTLVKDADHRLSSPPDLDRMIATLEGLLA
ncbi:alpha/beta hydrolase [Parvularcula dongshanensis]|uniref:Palmitoyl-protein thioesterase ABHD10, mitochondrial n=1 Tax=Parvularcula dongshanensis TaxID=1173995 RepID=A0A840I0K4_9PROT|nr:alpha/beta hydrolase [Parvularcula dongshanensis]MBB4658596.1 pimeloyl-ACP methyl ester carboxylesterase [Parvularcula dongshanensis]